MSGTSTREEMKHDPIIMDEFSIFKVLIPEGAMARARTFCNNGS